MAFPAGFGDNRIMIDSRRRLWIVALLGAFVPLGCAPERPDSGAARQPAPTATEEAVPRGKPFAVVETEKGPIVIELLEEAAPKTVANFIELAEVPTVDDDLPGTGCIQTGKQPQQRGLARAGGAQHRHRVARRNAKVDIIQYG